MLRSTINRQYHPVQALLPRWCDANQRGASSQRVVYPAKKNTANKQTNQKPMYLSTNLAHNDARAEWYVLLHCDLLYRSVLSRRISTPPGMLDVRPRF